MNTPAEPVYNVECPTCLGYGHMNERGRPTIDRRGRKCLTCSGAGWVPGPAVLPSAPMAAPKNPRGGRKPRSGVVADEKVTIRLTGEEHARFSRAALAAGFKMPVTQEHPEPRGAVGAWLRSLGLKETP